MCNLIDLSFKWVSAGIFRVSLHVYFIYLRDSYATFTSETMPAAIPPYRPRVPCFVCSGSSQWSGRKVDLTDHPWVMMMRGLLLLNPQEVSVCSCRGSSAQLSSPSENILKAELLTYGSFSLRTTLCSVSAAPPKSNSTRVIFWCVYFEVNDYK